LIRASLSRTAVVATVADEDDDDDAVTGMKMHTTSLNTDEHHY